ncbi:MAG: hypothetical protein WC606_05345 [Candidatus Absconditabacterales bacterium]
MLTYVSKKTGSDSVGDVFCIRVASTPLRLVATFPVINIQRVS